MTGQRTRRSAQQVPGSRSQAGNVWGDDRGCREAGHGHRPAFVCGSAVSLIRQPPRFIGQEPGGVTQCPREHREAGAAGRAHFDALVVIREIAKTFFESVDVLRLRGVEVDHCVCQSHLHFDSPLRVSLNVEVKPMTSMSMEVNLFTSTSNLASLGMLQHLEQRSEFHQVGRDRLGEQDGDTGLTGDVGRLRMSRRDGGKLNREDGQVAADVVKTFECDAQYGRFVSAAHRENLSLRWCVSYGKTHRDPHLGQGSETLAAGGTPSKLGMKTAFFRPEFVGLEKSRLSMGLVSGVPVDNREFSRPTRPKAKTNTGGAPWK